MMRHVVMFRWREGVSSADVAAAEQAIAALPSHIPDIQALTIGRDAGLASGNHDLVVEVDLTDRAAYQRYADHEAHQDLIRTHLRPLIDERAAVQYEF